MSAPSKRATRQVVKEAAAALSGKRRGQDRQVRRSSYDIEDPRAKVFRPIGDGTVAGALGWIDDLLATAKEFDVLGRKDRSRGPLTPYGVAVLEALLKGNQVDFRTGRLEPAIAWIEKVTGFARKTVVDALARLRKHGFLDWVRRSRRTDNAPGKGPQREQATNAYFFDLSGMAKHVLQRWRDLRQRRRRRAANQAPGSPAASPAGIADPGLAGALDRLGKLIPGASTA